ncbi:MFS transporter [Zoogloea sp.]|uniref:MFS transporter n=1 Tax=Zoogloea sp. TaxID=49181 RepID=UPI002607C76E|nr:MFS transporter [Zoogloea sp.]MDD3352961.1 MFS transporter [Zoogloea sp.]
MTNQFRLLATHRFRPFFLTQFLGAFNDNLFKNALVVLLTFQAARWTPLDPALLANLAGGIFILPFFLFSASAGQLADKYDKAALTRLVKLLEIGIMGVALTGFLAHSLIILFGALFLLGCHSTLFGPVKYALLPQHLKPDELVGGNALVEAGTFVAILLGTLTGGLLAAAEQGALWIAGGGMTVAVAGYLSSRHIPPAPAPAPGLKINPNPLTETWRNIAFARQNRSVFLAILGISWFWLYGALFLAQFPAYAKTLLGGGEGTVTLLLATFTVGIGVGSLLCEKLSGGHLEIGLVPFGSIGLTLFGLDLAWASPTVIPSVTSMAIGDVLAGPGTLRILVALMMLGVFGGFFIVPLYAMMQSRSAPEQRARIIAANNILNALFMVAGALAAGSLLSAGLSLPILFGIAALMNAAVALYIYRQAPEFLLRFIVWLLIHSVYRLRTRGLEHIPAEGPAILVCNHVSFVDALVITAACPRPIRFVMSHRIFRWPILAFFFRHSRVIPIAPAKEDPAMMKAAFTEASSALAAGELVGIFPEGRITSDGKIGPFQPGITRILKANPVPVVPLALRGLWRSTLSRGDGSASRRLPRCGLLNQIELIGGPALNPSTVSLEILQTRVTELRGK